jgi:hypothetical protein
MEWNGEEHLTMEEWHEEGGMGVLTFPTGATRVKLKKINKKE